MLDIKFIRTNPHLVQQNCRDRGVEVDINHLLEIDDARRDAITRLQQIQEKRNKISKTKPGADEIEEMRQAGLEIKSLNENIEGLESEFRALMNIVPNMSHGDVRVSRDENDNPVIEQVGKIRKISFEPKDHLELAVELDLIDLERGAKVSGAKFYYLKNELALLEFALIQYTLEKIIAHGFVPMLTPDLVKIEIVENMGFSPRGESTQVYNVFNTDLSLIGTAEISLGGYHLDEILETKELPKKYVSVTHCFRTEAGATSKYAKGIFRVHQFTKIEMFVYTTPEQSEKIHQELLEIEKEIWSGLEIPFRVVDHCTADLGAPSQRTFDLEAWMPGQANKAGARGDWAEVTSTSNCTDYQARSMNIRYRNGEGKIEFVHTLNGTGIADTRAMIAIMENFQNEDGSIDIPKVLHKYLLKGIKKIKR